MTICCVVGCNSRSSSKEKCYMAKLPSDPVRRKKWIENIEQVANTKKISSEASVCEVKIVFNEHKFISIFPFSLHISI